jgi:hypothetical protein
VPQKPAISRVNQPQHTFFEVNVQVVEPQDLATLEVPGKEVTVPANTPPPNGQLSGFPNGWLTFANRPLISPAELFMVSKYRPHELTQLFALGPNNPRSGEPSEKYKYLADWFDPQQNLYRFFDFVSASSPIQWCPVGGRVLGRININTVWDREIFYALTDPQASNFFYDPSLATIDKIFDKMIAGRSPWVAPSAGDRPFQGMGSGPTIDDTFLRPDPFDNRAVAPQDKRRVFEPEFVNPLMAMNRSHPYIRQELMRKIFNNVTTRSNVFAVWLTVGFFEVRNDAVQPPVLGGEIGRAEGRHRRHRMFAVIDRSSVTMASRVVQTAAGPPPTGVITPGLGYAGPQPVIVPTHQAIFPNSAPQWVEIPRTGMNNFEGRNWTIRPGDWLLVDPGPNQEVVYVASSNWWNSIYATFLKPHPPRCALIKVHDSTGITAGLPGNPGPQLRFDVRNPAYQGVIRHFSIIE